MDKWPAGAAGLEQAHERMHRTLGEETANPPASTIAAQQAKFDAWQVDFNANRPHGALAQRRPGAVYRPSARMFPETVRPRGVSS